MPEFAHRGIYDERGKAVAFRAFDISKEWLLQKGLRVPLLCETCEGILNDRYEKAFERFWYAGSKEPVQLRALDDISLLTLTVPEPSRFILFHLSVIWRAGAASGLHSQFADVRLGHHQDKIRRMLLEGPESMENHAYSLVCYAVERPGERGVLHELVSPPSRLRHMYGQQPYCITFGGCMWFYFIASHRTRELEEIRLQDDGTLPIVKRRWKQAEAFMPYWRAADERRRRSRES